MVKGEATPLRPPLTAKPEELAKIREKTGQIEALVKDAVVKVKPGAAVPDLLTAGLFDEHWKLPK